MSTTKIIAVIAISVCIVTMLFVVLSNNLIETTDLAPSVNAQRDTNGDLWIYGIPLIEGMQPPEHAIIYDQGHGVIHYQEGYYGSSTFRESAKNWAITFTDGGTVGSAVTNFVVYVWD